MTATGADKPDQTAEVSIDDLGLDLDQLAETGAPSISHPLEETDHPADFLDLVQGLRETRASFYTLRDTPIFTCTQQDIRTVLSHVGGV